MKKLILLLCLIIASHVNFAQPVLGSELPALTFSDIDGNNYETAALLNSGKHLCFIFGQAEEFVVYDITFFPDLNEFYDIYGPSGTDEVQCFFIESNPYNNTDAIYGNNSSEYNYDLGFDFPIVDATIELLNTIDETGFVQGNEFGFHVGVCPNGLIAQMNYVMGASYENLVSECNETVNGSDLFATVYSNINYCENGFVASAKNGGTVVITDFDYTITFDGVTQDYSWSGELLPFNSLPLIQEYASSLVSHDYELSISFDDLDNSNNTATGSIPGGEASSNHLKFIFNNSNDEEGYYDFELWGADMNFFEMYNGSLPANQTTVVDFYVTELNCYYVELYSPFFDGTTLSINYVNAEGIDVELYAEDEAMGLIWQGEGEIHVTDFVPFNLTATVFHDQNEDGYKDSFEPGIGGIEVHLGSQVTYTDANGQYTFYDVNIEDYTEVSIVYDDAVWPNTTTGATLPIDNGMMSNFNFGLSTNEPFYLLTSYSAVPWFFCGFDSQLYITAQNEGNTAASGLLTVTLDPLLTYTGASPTPVSFDGTTVVWDISTLPLGGTAYFYVDVVAPTFEQMGETLTTALNVITYDGEGVEVANNTTVHAGIVNCSYDPNDITGFPAGFTDAHYIMNGTELEYLVRFQNTGNYQAFNIRVDDQLDTDLDFSTFEFIGSSHACVPVLNTETGFIQFYFDDINLPDSTTDEAGSHGWLRYRIAPQNTLAEMTTIDNTAYIYFDFNPAVITNTYTHTISDLYFGVGELVQTNLIVYPNPTNGIITITSANANAAITITDLNGRIAMSERLTASKRVDTALLAQGVYIIECIDDMRVQRTRLVVSK
ncbi:MAG: T9SS type A sorting domain-containing protein [Flavobacteriales bacterium]